MGRQPPHISRRLVLYYVVVGLAATAVLIVGFSLGADRHPEPNVSGVWTTAPGPADPCLGPVFTVRQSGAYANVVPVASTGASGKLDVKHGRLSGDVDCIDGHTRHIAGRVTPPGRTLRLTVGARRVVASDTGKPVPAAGAATLPPSSLAGTFATVPASACLGAKVAIKDAGHGRFTLATVNGPPLGAVTFDSNSGAVLGVVRCHAGTPGPIQVMGGAVDRTVTITLLGPKATVVGQVQLQRQRDTEDLFAAFFLAIGVVMLAAQLGGMLMHRLGQPRVMGEVLSGILLGPTLLGALAPRVENALFPTDVIPYIAVAAQLGLIFYMFLIGLDLDLRALRGNVSRTLAISNTGVVVPMALGVLAAVPLYPLLGTSVGFVPFALFMGVSMSVTAFPVLARILVERRMATKPLGTLALSSAAIDDVTAWALIALASATIGAGTGSTVLVTIGLTIGFVLIMVFLVRPLLSRVAVAFSEAGRVPPGWIVIIFAGVLASAYTTEQIGVAIIFGAFVMGTIMPRHAGLTEDVSRRLESFVAIVLLPLFFASTGLKTNMLLIDRPELVFITLALSVLAIVAKGGGTILAGRVTGLGWRDSGVIASLMNTRGLTELIVLNLALDKGVISQALFAALVVMALVTTFMTGPLLHFLDPKNALGEDSADAFEAALPAVPSPAPGAEPAVPQRRILVAPESNEGLAALLAITEPLARSEPQREIVMVRLLSPTPGTEIRGGLHTDRRRLTAATRELRATRAELEARGIAARGAALTSTNPGIDIAKIADREHVDLVVLDGRRPLVGSAIPGGASAGVLARAEPDVVVVVSSERHTLPPPPGAPVVVPFGGAPHDWAALELGAWLSSALGVPMRLLGTTRPEDESGDDASKLLANASLMLQGFLHVDAEPVIVGHGGAGVLEAAQGAGLLVVGLSDRWRQEGLGSTRAQLARAAPAPILFVRRGTRAGVLAGREDVTRFTWSSAGARPMGPMN